MISCSDYDYIEIACLYHYPVRLTMKQGESVEGVALDTQRDEANNECILVQSEGEDSKLVILNDVRKLEVTIENPHFNEVEFK